MNQSDPSFHMSFILMLTAILSKYSLTSLNSKFAYFFIYFYLNIHKSTIRCTLTAIPESQTLLSKCRLPLGILIHPFKDLESLKVVQSSTIVRCRNCRSYINPFVHFIDNSKWRCNMCYSINDCKFIFIITAFFCS